MGLCTAVHLTTMARRRKSRRFKIGFTKSYCSRGNAEAFLFLFGSLFYSVLLETIPKSYQEVLQRWDPSDPVKGRVHIIIYHLIDMEGLCGFMGTHNVLYRAFSVFAFFLRHSGLFVSCCMYLGGMDEVRGSYSLPKS